MDLNIGDASLCSPISNRLVPQNKIVFILNILNPSDLVGAHKTQNPCTFNGLKNPESWLYSHKKVKLERKVMVYDHAMSVHAISAGHAWSYKNEKKSN